MTGAGVTIRPIGPEDRDALRRAFERLSPESRYRRFFVRMDELSDRDLDYLTDVDHHDHEALVAVDDRSRELIGVARFVRVGVDEAEPAVVVADDWQHRGIGTLLLDALVDRARSEAVARFRAQVLSDNPGAVAVLSKLGPTEQTREGSVVELEIALTPARQARSRLLSLLRQAAAGTLTPAFTVLQRLAWRAPRTPLDRASLGNAIVVGSDGTDEAALTVRRAAELARALRAELELVYVRRRAVDPAPRSEPELDALSRELRDSGLTVHVRSRAGGTVAALVEVAVERRAALIVVDASAPATGAVRLLAGDVPYAVARHAPCDVLLLRSRELTPSD